MKEELPVRREVIVPVFLRVCLTAEDDLAAECAAVDAIRAMGCLAGSSDGKVIIGIHSIIAPHAAGH